MKEGQSLETRDQERVEAYIAVRKRVDRTQIMQGLTMSSGDVKAIAARLEKAGRIRIEEKPTGGAVHVWTGGPVTVGASAGVTPAPSGSAPGVTPAKGRAGVTEASPGPRRGVTPKLRGRKLRLDRAEKIERATAAGKAPSNGAGRVLERIGKMMQRVSCLAESSSLGDDSAVKEQLVGLASEALKWRIELLEPDQRELLTSLFGLPGGAA